MIELRELADWLSVDPGDVRVLLDAQGAPAGAAVPDEHAAAVRRALDPHGERTAPWRLYWPEAADEDAPEQAGVAFPSPTREATYPDDL